ncbi:MAG: NYN domain-containing protein [Brucellaceae bacterium]|nr:NYN domain-containing protein [Brucellaceae bacterium]
MDRVAVFVDSGYLFAQGSAAISGRKQKRPSLVLDPGKAIHKLEALALQKAPGCRLLRIYWYDGALGGMRPTADQALLAALDNVKLRLGFVNSAGQQKGVDSLIVTDLIELARLQSISDAVLLSGDEDVRVGVQIAQNYGVRIHLFGIEPARSSQSVQLIHEADTTLELSKAEVEEFLSVRPKAQQASAEPEQAVATAPPDAIEQSLQNAVSRYVTELVKSQIVSIEAYWKTERGVPSEHDRPLLAACRQLLDRELTRSEIRLMRASFQQEVKTRSAELDR